MKSAPFLAGVCAVLGAATLLARADNAAPVDLKSTSPMQAPISGAAPIPDGPVLTPVSPLDAIDFTTTDPEQVAEQTIALRDQRTKSPDLNAYDQEQRQRAYDNDWMLRAYTAQLKKEGLANTPETDPSMVPHPADPNAPQSFQDPLLPQNQVKPQKPRQTRFDPSADPTSGLTPNSALSPLALQPLLPPLNPTAKHPAPRNAWGSPDATTDDTSAADMTDTFAPAPTPDLDSDNSTGSLLDSPGMTAQQEGLTRSNDLNLQDQDPMPDVVNTDRATSHLNRNTDFMVPTPPTSDVAEFFKKQAEALQPPTAPTATQPLQAATIAKPLPPLDAPEPFAKPPISGLRSHVADPFDILNR